MSIRTAVQSAAVRYALAAGLLATAGAGLTLGSTPEPSAVPSVDLSAAALPAAAPAADENAQGVFFVNGQLRINLANVSIVDVLNRVSSLTGVRIDIPPEASSKPLPVVKIGPASARDALSSLLSGMHLGYIIQASDNDPDKLQAVVIMALPPNKPGRPEATENAAAPRFNPPARPAAPPTVEPAPVQPEVASVTPNTPAPDNAPPMTAAAMEGPGQAAGAFSDSGAGSRPGALAPPAVLSPTSINQQLQQMYQQRMQMMQQVKSSPAGASGPAPATGTGPGAL